MFREVAVCNIWQPDTVGSYFIQPLPKIMVHSRVQITNRSHASLAQKPKIPRNTKEIRINETRINHPTKAAVISEVIMTVLFPLKTQT